MSNDPGKAHSDEHGELFDELLANAPDVRAALEGSPLAACPECRADLEGQLELMGELDDLGSDERAVLSDAGALEPGRAEDALRALITSETESARAPSRRRWPLWAAAAAALLAAALLFERLGDEATTTTPGDTILGSGITLTHPVGVVDDYAEFRFEATLPRRGWFVVLVYDATSDAHGAPLATSPRLTEPRWVPARRESEGWPAKIRWHVEAYRGTGGGDLADSEFAFAEHSSP